MATKITNVDGGKVEIQTTRLVLRAAKAGDELALNTAFSDPEVMRYWFAKSLRQASLADTVKERATSQGHRKNKGMDRQHGQGLAERRDRLCDLPKA